VSKRTLEEQVAELAQLTEKMLERLPVAEAEEISAFVRERGVAIQAIVGEAEGAPSEQRRSLQTHIHSILQADGLLIARMEQLKAANDQALRKVHDGKQQRNAYQAAYIQDEGYFVDKKR